MKQDKKQYCIFLNTNLHKQLKGVAAFKNKKMSNIISDALNLYFNENFKK